MDEWNCLYRKPHAGRGISWPKGRFSRAKMRKWRLATARPPCPALPLGKVCCENTTSIVLYNARPGPFGRVAVI
jgi:hypothetical protein